MNQHKNLINCPTLRIIGNLVTFVAVFSLAAVFAQAQWATNGSNINNTNTGSVGVGTTAPDRKLSVNNTAAQNEEIISVYRPASSNTSAGRSAVAFEFRGDAYSNNPNFYGWNVSASNSVMAKISATPKSYLELGSAIAGIHSSLGFFVSSAGHGGLLERMSILGNGNVGIGATNPTTKLHLMSGTDSASSLLSLDTGVHGGSVFTVGGTGNNESSFDLSVYRAGTYSSRLGVGSAGQLYLQPAGTAFVGIGTTNPATMLHVVGDGTVTGNLTVGGNIAAKYQDVAEWVDSSQELLAGTVVVLDAKRANQVIAATQAYDTRVAGVISVQPGVALGEGGKGRVLVATTGRVKVKVDATSGPIQIGDLLVTSDREGFAMKSEPVTLGNRRIHTPGTLIGKALEPLAKGTGEILVLLSLQ